LYYTQNNVERLVCCKSDDERQLNKNQPDNSAPTNRRNLLVDQSSLLISSKPFVPNDPIQKDDVKRSQKSAEKMLKYEH
jgi:hypothetical protein